MNVRQAIEDTMILAQQSQIEDYLISDLSYTHLQEMHQKIRDNPDWSETKLCRWLGWMQATVVSWGVFSLEDMKFINMRNSDA